MDRHRDALEFADGRIVLVTDLAVGQKASVLQLRVISDHKPAAAAQGQAAVEA